MSPPLSRSPSPPPPWRLVVTRTADQANAFGDKLRIAGFMPLFFPVIALEALPPAPLDAALDEIASFDWLIFTSGNGVDLFFQRLDARRSHPQLRTSRHTQVLTPIKWPRIAAVGQATATRLTTRNISVAFMPDEFVGEALAAGLGDLRGQKVLLLRAKIGRPEFAAMLKAQGAELVEVALYDTVMAVPTLEAWQTLAQGFEIISFTSPSTVRSFLQLIAGKAKIKKWVDTAVILCIGPVTAETAVTNGLPNPITPDEYTLDGIIAILKSKFS